MENLEDLLSFSVKDLKRCGVFGGFPRIITLRRGSLSCQFEVGFDVFRGEISVRFNVDGERKAFYFRTEEHASHLGRGSYLTFVCPISGRQVRRLYFFGGGVYSRHALRGVLYRTQTTTRRERTGLLAAFRKGLLLDEHLKKQRRPNRRRADGSPNRQVLKYRKLLEEFSFLSIRGLY